MEYTGRFGFVRADLWRYPLLIGVIGTIAYLLMAGYVSEDGELPRPVELAVGALILAVIVPMSALRLVTGIARPVALHADRSGLTVQPFGLLSGYVTLPWSEVASVAIRTDTTRAHNQWLVVRRLNKAGPLRRRLPLTALHLLTASQVPGCDLRRDIAVSVDYWWRLDRDRFARAVRAHAPRRVRIQMK